MASVLQGSCSVNAELFCLEVSSVVSLMALNNLWRSSHLADIPAWLFPLEQVGAGSALSRPTTAVQDRVCTSSPNTSGMAPYHSNLEKPCFPPLYPCPQPSWPPEDAPLAFCPGQMTTSVLHSLHICLWTCWCVSDINLWFLQVSR